MDAWRNEQPVVDASPEPVIYERGSMGPHESDGLLDPDREWLSG
jgi:hypothetical protein